MVKLLSMVSNFCRPSPAAKQRSSAGGGRFDAGVVRARVNEKSRVEEQAQTAAQEGQGLLDGLAKAQGRLQVAGVSLGNVTATCGLVGTTLGSLFQITHNVGGLPIYDVWAFNLGPFPEAGTIPILLAPIWLLYGYVAPILDEYLARSDPRAQGSSTGREQSGDLGFVLLTWAALAAQFLFSDLVYQAGAPHWVCSLSLALLALAIWRKFDNTKAGAILAALLTVGAPAGEMLIVNFLHLWHYSRPDTFGVPHWAGWCYATYAIGVANVSRYLVLQQKKRQS